MAASSVLALAAAGLFALGGCVPSVPEPAPAPVPAPAPSPPPTPTPTPLPRATDVPTPSFDNWMDAPQTPGDWSYEREGTETLAIFGSSPAAPLLIVRCDLASRNVGLARTGSAPGGAIMRIRTETQDRTLEANPVPSQTGLVAAELPASDGLWDAIAFSKGRFAVETGGMQTLYVPAWPEITRVVEDCR